MKKSIKQIVSEHQRVLDTRKRLEDMFSMIAKCYVTVGGSYTLKYWCEAFADREVSDYDFILHALPEDCVKIESFVELLHSQTCCVGTPGYYDYKSFYFGHLHGKKVNIILKPGHCACAAFESIEDIIAVKRAWCEKAIKEGKKPRYKDVEDIATYEKWESDNDLPF